MTSSHVILKNPSGAACGEGPVYIGDAAQQVCSDEKLRLEKSTIHQTVRAQNMPYQPLSIKTHFLLRMGGGGGGGGLHLLISTIKNFLYILLKFIGEQDSGKKNLLRVTLAAIVTAFPTRCLVKLRLFKQMSPLFNEIFQTSASF